MYKSWKITPPLWVLLISAPPPGLASLVRSYRSTDPPARKKEAMFDAPEAVLGNG